MLPGLLLKARQVTLGSNETYTPDLRQAAHHHIDVAGTPVTIDNPILGGMAFSGWANILLMHVANTRGGPINVNWGSLYRQAPWSDPSNGKGIIMIWNLDPFTGLWISTTRNADVPNS